MRLYSFSITPNNRKVEAFVRHFYLPVEIHQVSFKDRETQTPAFLAINPMGKVPALTDGGLSLWESNAILTYLAGRFPETKALPTDLAGRADVDRWLHWQNCHLAPALVGMQTAEGKPVTQLATVCSVLDARLGDQEFLLGSLSVADFALGSYFLTKSARHHDLSPYPRIRAWIGRVEELRGFVQTRPRQARTS